MHECKGIIHALFANADVADAYICGLFLIFGDSNCEHVGKTYIVILQEVINKDEVWP